MVIHASDTLPAVPDRPVLDLLLGDVVRLRKMHPCGGDTWLVDRLGADIGLRCQGCRRHNKMLVFRGVRSTFITSASSHSVRGAPGASSRLNASCVSAATPGRRR